MVRSISGLVVRLDSNKAKDLFAVLNMEKSETADIFATYQKVGACVCIEANSGVQMISILTDGETGEIEMKEHNLRSGWVRESHIGPNGASFKLVGADAKLSSIMRNLPEKDAVELRKYVQRQSYRASKMFGACVPGA